MTDFVWADGAAGFLEIDGGRLEYACHGLAPAQSPTIILMHEGLGSVALWKDFPEALAKTTGLGVFVYSRFGYGKSSPCALPRPLDYMTQEAVDVLPKVLDAINLEKGILMGHSDGGTIASIYVGSLEDFRIRGLIVMAPHYFTEPEGLSSIEQSKELYEQGDLNARLSKYHDDVDCAFWGWNSAWLDPEFKEWNVSEVIDYLRIPTLAIQGAQDAYGTLAQIEEISSRSYAPVDVAIIEDCGHSPHRDQPEKVLESVSEFTARLVRIETEEVLLKKK